jgi:hypothetical protein
VVDLIIDGLLRDAVRSLRGTIVSLGHWKIGALPALFLSAGVNPTSLVSVKEGAAGISGMIGIRKGSPNGDTDHGD